MPNVDAYRPIPQNMTDSESDEEIRYNSQSVKNTYSKISTKSTASSSSYPNKKSVSITGITLRNHSQSQHMHQHHHQQPNQHKHMEIMNNTLQSTNSTNSEDCNCNIGTGSVGGVICDSSENISVLNIHDNLLHVMKNPKNMSLLRKLTFILSILLCILTIILFLWIIPCSEDLRCPAKTERIKSHNWMRNYEKIELKGMINIIDGLFGHSKNLIFMYCGNKFDTFINDNRNSIHKINKQPRRNGIISITGNLGQVAWYDEMINEPQLIDCTLIDVDQNGSPDCLIIDEYGEVGAIQPISGKWLWHTIITSTNELKNSSSTNDNNQRLNNIHKVTKFYLNFPLILPDLNNDGVLDLLIASTGDGGVGDTSSLLLLSGSNGHRIGQRDYQLSNDECLFVHKFQLDTNLTILFNCIKIDSEVQIKKSLNDLYLYVTNYVLPLKLPYDLSSTTPPPLQYKFYGQRKDTINQRNIYSVSDKQLIIENNGKCPDNCNVTVQLIEEKNGKTIIIKNFNGNRMYGMVPAIISFNNTNQRKQYGNKHSSPVYGFVIKFWEWSSLNGTTIYDNDNPDNIDRNYRIKRTIESNNLFNSFSTITNNHNKDEEFNKFSNILIKKRSWKLPTSMKDNIIINDKVNIRLERSLKNLTNTKNKKHDPIFITKMRLIKETVLLIIFNSTDTRIENTSQSNIIQFCREEIKSKSKITSSNQDDGNDINNSIIDDELLCQPDLNYQENSILINDLDQDGSQELVSYYSTFVKIEGNNEMNIKNVLHNKHKHYKLITYVQLLRLESELPKLYSGNDEQIKH